MNDTAIETTPTLLMKAMEENLLDHVSFIQERLPHMKVDRQGGLVIVDSGLSGDTFNKVLAFRLAPDEADSAIDRALAYTRGTGRTFSWWVGPCSRPLDLQERLYRYGLRVQERELGMTIELSKAADPPELPSGTEIFPVDDNRRLADFAGVLSGLSDPPDREIGDFFRQAANLLWASDCPMRLFVAYVDGQPAAVSELFVGGGLAGVHMVATAEKFRRRGLGMALTWTVLDQGRRLGLTHGGLQASDEGRPVYERLGFEANGSFVEYGFG